MEEILIIEDDADLREILKFISSGLAIRPVKRRVPRVG